MTSAQPQPSSASRVTSAWVGAATGAASLLIVIIGLPLHKLAAFVLLALALLPWVIVLALHSWQHHGYLLAALLSTTLIAVAVAVLMGWHQRSSAPPVSTPPALKFIPNGGAVPQPISHCVTLAGSGTIPSGDALVLFDRPTDSNGNYTADSTFSLDGQAATTPTGWIASDLAIGSGTSSDQGQHVAIVAVLMPQGTADFLNELPSDGSGHVPPDVIALGTQTDKLNTVRNANNAACP